MKLSLERLGPPFCHKMFRSLFGCSPNIYLEPLLWTTQKVTIACIALATAVGRTEYEPTPWTLVPVRRRSGQGHVLDGENTPEDLAAGASNVVRHVRKARKQLTSEARTEIY